MPKLVDQGENYLLQVFCANATMYLGLYTSPTTEPPETAQLTNITEPSGNGYARIQLLANDWSISGDTATNVQKTFTATGGNWGNVYGYFICTVASGTAGNLIVVSQFSDGPYVVNNGGGVIVLPKLRAE